MTEGRGGNDRKGDRKDKREGCRKDRERGGQHQRELRLLRCARNDNPCGGMAGNNWSRKGA